MATTSDDSQEEPQHAGPQPFWHMREDDQRLLFITFLGGLAANVGLVLIVGLGLVEAHLIHRYQHAISFAVLVTAVQSVTTLLLWLNQRLRPSPKDPKDLLQKVRMGLEAGDIDEETARILSWNSCSEN